MNDPESRRRDHAIAEPKRDGGRQEAAHYIMSQIEQLATLARRHQLDLLGYLLDMARLEARDSSKRRDDHAL